MMVVIISFILIAIVIIAILFMFNMNVGTNEKIVENSSQHKKKENIQEEVIPCKPITTPIDYQVQEKMESRDIVQSKTTNISDQAYRRALQSFRIKNQDEADRKPKEKMNDDVFRKALQSMSKVDEDSNIG